MNRLQLYITISYNGYKKMLEINPDPAIAQHVADISEALEDIDFIPREKHIFYLLKYIPEGTFIVVIRTIPESSTDHLAAWVFVPAGIDIKANDLTGLVGTVSGMLSNSKITGEDVGRLRQLFSRVYPADPGRGRMVGNYGVQYAHRFYGSDTGLRLTDLIGNMRYQTTYLPYAGVILADKDDVNSIDGMDLTPRSLKKMVRLLPPDPVDGPYQPTIYNQPFDAPYLVPMGSVVEIQWTARGLEDVTQTVDVLRDDIKPENINTAASARPFPVADAPAEDTLADNPATPEPEAEPQPETAPGIETTIPAEYAPAADDEGDDIEVLDSTAEAAEADEGKDTEETNDDAPAATPTTPQGRNLYVFEIPSRTAAMGGMIRFEIRSRMPITTSPLEGYDLTDIVMEGPTRTNHLVYNGEGTTRSRLVWGGIGLVAGVLLSVLVGMFACGRGGDTAPTPAPADSAAQAATAAPQATPALTGIAASASTASTEAPAASAQASTNPADISAAVKYLDANKTWEKGAMEQLPALRGLYDDMNNYNLDAIINTWGPRLKASTSFTKLVFHANNAVSGKKMEKNNVTAPYNKNANDTKIGVYAYECRIDK